MSTSTQSSNLTNLYAELGFSKDLPGRDPTVIRKALTHCRLESLNEGIPRPYHKTDSQEAKDLAREFCERNQRAKGLWPDNPGGAWPSWSKDRKKIIDLVAHALSRKAYYKYQKNLKDQKKATLSTKDTSIGNTMAPPAPRELSPESSKYMEPLPKGTKRRPATGPDQGTTVQEAPGTLSQEASKQYVPPMVSNPAPEVDSDFRLQCIEHTKQLKPKTSHKIFAGLTKKWILNPNGACPRSVDNKILTLMHDKKVYDPESKDNKLILLVDQLRNGLDLEGLEYYNIIEARVLDRINIHARDLYSKGFIVSSDGASGQYRQAEEFRKCWENKEKYWGDHASASDEVQEPETPRPKTPATSTTIDPSGDADDRLFVGPEPTPPPAANPMANKAFRTKPPTTPKSNKRTGNNIEDYMSPPQTKRAKTARPSGLSGIVSEKIFPKTVDKGKQPEAQIIEEGGDIPNAGPSKIPGMGSGSIFPKKSIEKEKEIEPQPEEDENMQDAETEEHIGFAKNFLSAPTGFGNATPSRPSTPPQTSTTGNQPMTPTSPTLSVGTLAHERQRARSKSPAENKLRNSPQLLSPPASSSRSNSRSKPEIFLTLQDKNRKYDVDNPVPASRLSDSSLSNFLGLVAQRSNIPFHDITCLTFSLISADEIISDIYKVVHKDNEEEFESVKEKIKRSYRIWKSKNAMKSMKTFEVLVDIGDPKAISDEEGFYGGM